MIDDLDGWMNECMNYENEMMTRVCTITYDYRPLICSTVFDSTWDCRVVPST